MSIYYCLYLLFVYGLAFGDAHSSQDGCVLPPYPAHGTYSVHNQPNAAPGQVLELAILAVTCDPGYGVEGNNMTYCFQRNQWQQPMPECKRFCKLDPHPSVKYLCKVTGEDLLSGIRHCREFEPHGTVVVPECNRPVYHSAGGLRDMRCVEGSWDHVAVCQPECGTITAKGTSLVRNGTQIERGELPWHAGIYAKSYTPYMQICGGSLVSTSIIISAAHCFWDPAAAKQQPASGYAVALGKTIRAWDSPDDVGAHKSDVRDIKTAPHFLGQASNFQEDIALVFMTTPVVYVTFIRPVCIDFSEELDRIRLQALARGKSAGWGLTSEDGDPSPLLKSMELTYVDEDTCMDRLPSHFEHFFTCDKICVSPTKGVVCRGDAGGGVVFPTMDIMGTRRFYLQGIISVSPRDEHKCNVKSDVLLTHVLKHEDFIKTHLNNNLE